MKTFLFALILLMSSVLAAQNVPHELVGKWIIQRELPTRTISCWGEKEAKSIIGTEIEYTAVSFRWDDRVVKHPRVKVSTVTAEQFDRDNSSPSVNGSQVSFAQLGIKEPQAIQVSITHAPATITRATTEIPGDEVLIKDSNTIVFSVCNLFFQAKRRAVTAR